METKQKNLEKAVALLKLLSHPVRLSILCKLVHLKEMSVSEIVETENGSASQSQISQFLAKMRNEDLVECRKEAQTVYYKIKSAQAKKVVEALYEIYCGKSSK